MFTFQCHCILHGSKPVRYWLLDVVVLGPLLELFGLEHRFGFILVMSLFYLGYGICCCGSFVYNVMILLP